MGGRDRARNSCYFAPDGGLTAGPLLLPGCPGILDESCWRTARFCSLMSEPVVSDEDFAAGPLLLPGLPGIPAPEFCPLGTVTWPPSRGAVFCAEAGSVMIASAIAPVSNLNMANSLLYDMKQKPAGSILFSRNGFANHFVPAQRPASYPPESLFSIAWRSLPQNSVSSGTFGSISPQNRPAGDAEKNYPAADFYPFL
jgi:hypothetical protein